MGKTITGRSFGGCMLCGGQAGGKDPVCRRRTDAKR